MRTLAELQALKQQIEERIFHTGLQVLVSADALTLVEQAIADRATIGKWYNFMHLMSKKSSWGAQIMRLLDEYFYGTTDERVREAAKHYLEYTRLHERK